MPYIRLLGAIAFNRQNGPLAVRGTRAFHDRFVIVDERDYYHLGASIKDAGRRGAMFSRLEETSIVDALRAEINSQWAAGADLLAVDATNSRHSSRSCRHDSLTCSSV